jgi:hypothetical protein
MSLEILHNRAEHTHENEQFRRCALELKTVFSLRNWDGVLIGNPFNDNFHSLELMQFCAIIMV